MTTRRTRPLSLEAVEDRLTPAPFHHAPGPPQFGGGPDHHGLFRPGPGEFFGRPPGGPDRAAFRGVDDGPPRQVSDDAPARVAASDRLPADTAPVSVRDAADPTPAAGQTPRVVAAVEPAAVAQAVTRTGPAALPPAAATTTAPAVEAARGPAPAMPAAGSVGPVGGEGGSVGSGGGYYAADPPPAPRTGGPVPDAGESPGAVPTAPPPAEPAVTAELPAATPAVGLWGVDLGAVEEAARAVADWLPAVAVEWPADVAGSGRGWWMAAGAAAVAGAGYAVHSRRRTPVLLPVDVPFTMPEGGR